MFKKQKVLKRKQNIYDNIKQKRQIGRWSNKQKLNYLIFVDYFKQKLEKKQNRRLWRIFKTMSFFLKSRTSIQCRCYHQKMQRTFQSLDEVILNGKKYFKSYQQHYQKSLKQLKELLFLNSIILIKDKFQNSLKQFDQLSNIKSQNFKNFENEYISQGFNSGNLRQKNTNADFILQNRDKDVLLNCKQSYPLFQTQINKKVQNRNEQKTFENQKIKNNTVLKEFPPKLSEDTKLPIQIQYQIISQNFYRKFMDSYSYPQISIMNFDMLIQNYQGNKCYYY